MIIIATFNKGFFFTHKVKPVNQCHGIVRYIHHFCKSLWIRVSFNVCNVNVIYKK